MRLQVDIYRPVVGRVATAYGEVSTDGREWSPTIHYVEHADHQPMGDWDVRPVTLRECEDELCLLADVALAATPAATKAALAWLIPEAFDACEHCGADVNDPEPDCPECGPRMSEMARGRKLRERAEAEYRARLAAAVPVIGEDDVAF